MPIMMLVKAIQENLFLKDTMRYEKGGTENIEIAKVTSIKFVPENLVKLKVKLLEVVDVPAKLPIDVELEPMEEGVLLRAYKARIKLAKPDRMRR